MDILSVIQDHRMVIKLICHSIQIIFETKALLNINLALVMHVTTGLSHGVDISGHGQDFEFAI